MPKIGIGITTTPKRADLLDLCRKQIERHSPDDIQLVVVNDINGDGVAHGKNTCLQLLRGSDYIFLFDDDCFPVSKGWIDHYVQAHERTGNHHFLYLKETPSIHQVAEKGIVERYNNCGGCFMFLTREVVEKVGGFHPNYGRYGFEHAGYTIRVHKAGLNPDGEYLSVKGAGEYIYSMDYDNHRDFGVKMVYNIDPAKVAGYVAENREVFEQDIEQIHQPL